MKKDFAQQIDLQTLKKENTSLKNQLEMADEQTVSLKGKIKELERSYQDSGESVIEKLALNQIKHTTNIRDEYDYEHIELLALDILEHGQLQPVLLTKDNYLLAGYRRFNAFLLLNEKADSINIPEHLKENKIPDYIIAYRLDINFSELNQEKIDLLQYSENEQRRSLDNFDISKLFCKYENLGYKQEEIGRKFNKSKGFVSSLISIKKIEPELIKKMKEFQVWAWSKKKFTTVNFENLTQKDKDFYQKNKGIIGWNLLYRIASQKNIEKQKEIFLKLFKNRLSEEELNSDYFKDALKEEISIDEKKLKAVFKNTKLLSMAIKGASTNLPENILKQLNKNLAQIESILADLNS